MHCLVLFSIFVVVVGNPMNKTCQKCICLSRDRDLICENGAPSNLPVNSTKFLDVQITDCFVTKEQLNIAFPHADIEVKCPHNCHRSQENRNFLFCYVYIMSYLVMFIIYSYLFILLSLLLFGYC